MNMVSDVIINAITGFFESFANDIISKSFDLMVTFLFRYDQLDKFIDLSLFLVFSRSVASALLVIAVLFQIFKSQSQGAFGSSDLSATKLTSKAIAGAVGIVIAPMFITDFLIPLNQAIVKGISGGVTADYTVEMEGIRVGLSSLANMGITVIVIVVILGISTFILSIICAIRYFDLCISVILAPLVSVSIIGNGSILETWIKESVSIVFTNSLQILMLKILIKILSSNQLDLETLLLAIGCVIVMMKGGTVIKTYLYKTGASGSMSTLSTLAIVKAGSKVAKGGA